MKRAIEDSFPIVEINRLAVPERNAFKPIYQMHKWFARRASSVFRAILLGALKPLPVDENGNPTKSGAEVIMEEFYKDHTHDPDTNGKVILDPFMGGGTTIVEALRLGCKTIGVDLNPVAWFIVKTETEPVDLDELKQAFERLAHRKVEWSGKPLRETLLDLYKTKCPSCGGEADIIYTFWVKSAPCTAGNCGRETPLFSDYIVAKKTPSIRYIEDCDCPKCGRVFDWEIEPACMIGNSKLMVNAARYSAGQGRTTARWSYGYAEKTKKGGLKGTTPCPWCGEQVVPAKSNAKAKRKKVDLTLLLCPKCEEVWQFRGPLSGTVQCPSCQHAYDPMAGNVAGTGKFLCSCGNESKTIAAIRTLQEDKLLPMHPYGMECYCSNCDNQPGQSDGDDHPDFFIKTKAGAVQREDGAAIPSFLWKNSGKFFKRVDAGDLARYQEASKLWERHKSELPYPKSRIPVGEKTKSGLLAHHYHYWHQMFNPRQLLCLSTLLKTIDKEQNQVLKEMLLSGFFTTLESNNVFTRHRADADKTEGVFARHDFQPKMTFAEGNVWGVIFGKCTFNKCFSKAFEGKVFCYKPFDRKTLGNKIESVYRNENVCATLENIKLYSKSSTHLDGTEKAEFIITDPPYASNVNYAELADFFYVWLRLILAKTYQEFTPELTPKTEEVIENPTRGKTAKDFESGLTGVFKECNRVIDDDGLLVFTFHHAEGSAWEALLQSVCNAGFVIECVYPIHGESESSLHLMGKEAISYDLIHICRKRPIGQETEKRSWAGIRQEIRRKAREEIKAIEAGRYGNEPLSPADINIVLIGKCLELYSKHYGNIIDHEGEPVLLKDALEEIKMLVDLLTTAESALPPELENIDVPSYVYLTCLCDRKEIKSDEVHKATRGICEPSILMERGLIIKGRAKRGRTYEVKSPLERLDTLKQKFGVGSDKWQGELFGEDMAAGFVPGTIFIDYVHLLIGLVETGESVFDWLERFRGHRPAIRAALEYISKKHQTLREPIRKIVGLMDEKTLFSIKEEHQES